MAGPLLRLDDVGLAYHSRRGIQAMLQHISFSLAQGEHLTVSGPSGCGKSTLLRLIAGLQAPTEGQIYFAGQKMTAPRPDLAIVFQDYGLFRGRRSKKIFSFQAGSTVLPWIRTSWPPSWTRWA